MNETPSAPARPPGREVDWRPDRAHRRDTQRRRRLILAGLFLIVAAGVLGAVLAGSGGHEGPDDATAAATGRWNAMAAGPLSPRIGAANAWTGQELLLWGGRDCAEGRCDDETVASLGDGAAYDPEADTWRSLAASPLAPRSGATGVWTGRELLVWGGRDANGPRADGAAYDPEADTWRSLPPSPLSPRGAPALWSGQEMLVWGGSVDATGQQVFADGAAYDPAADTWRLLAASPPLPARFDMLAEWTDQELLVWGGRAGSENLGDGAAYDPASDRGGSWPPPLCRHASSAASGADKSC